MSTITRFKSSDDYDPLHTLLNRPLIEIEADLTAAENHISTLTVIGEAGRLIASTGIAIEAAQFGNNAEPTLIRRGDLVSLSVSAIVKTANYLNSSTFRTLGQIPSGFRPAATGGTRYLVARTNGSSGGSAPLEVRPSGAILIRNYSLATHAANLVIEFSDTFIADGDYIGA